MTKTLAVLAGLIAAPVLGQAAPSFAPRTEVTVVTASIEVIDHDTREITLLDKHGEALSIRCGPEVEHFDRLRVGDQVTFRYYESVAYAIRKPGQPSDLTPTRGGSLLVPGPGPKPGATVSRQQREIVTVEVADARVPALTVLTEDGRRLSFRVPRGGELAHAQAGDRVEITYTQALLISVK
jgi:hypothetical protein